MVVPSARYAITALAKLSRARLLSPLHEPLARAKIRIPRARSMLEMENRTLREFTAVRVPIRFPFIGRRPRIRVVTNIRGCQSRATSNFGRRNQPERAHPLRLQSAHTLTVKRMIKNKRQLSTFANKLVKEETTDDNNNNNNNIFSFAGQNSRSLFGTIYDSYVGLSRNRAMPGEREREG